jgi:hypothetical protein
MRKEEDLSLVMWRFAIDMVAVLRVMQNNSSELISDMEE